jgi:uncharacterized protein
MSEKVGRNDPCPCGSGKKYKQCCLKKDQEASKPRGLRKFTAKVISAGGTHQAPDSPKPAVNQAAVDYNTLMERSFGKGIHANEAPPVPQNPNEYITKEEPNPSSNPT